MKLSFNTQRQKQLSRKATLGAMLALVLGGVGVYTFVSSATVDFAAIQTEGATVASPAVTVADTTASGSSAVRFATGSAQATLMGWQLTASNIGLAPFGLSCDSLPAYTGAAKPAAGARISNVKITTNLDLSNGNIIIDKSCIKPTTGNSRALVSNDVCGSDECVVTATQTVTIRDSEFDASLASASSIAEACAFRGVGTLQRNYMHGMGSGICFFGTGYQLNGLAEQNYVTGLRSAGDSHNEAATVRDFRINQNPSRTANFTNNRLDCQSGNETGGLFIQPTWVDIANVYVTGNYIEGGGYNLYLNKAGGNYSNVHATNNRFRSTGWGPAVVDGGAGWDEWANNYRYDSTKTDGKGAVVPQP